MRCALALPLGAQKKRGCFTAATLKISYTLNITMKNKLLSSHDGTMIPVAKIGKKIIICKHVHKKKRECQCGTHAMCGGKSLF